MQVGDKILVEATLVHVCDEPDTGLVDVLIDWGDERYSPFKVQVPTKLLRPVPTDNVGLAPKPRRIH